MRPHLPFHQCLRCSIPALYRTFVRTVRGRMIFFAACRTGHLLVARRLLVAALLVARLRLVAALLVARLRLVAALGLTVSGGGGTPGDQRVADLSEQDDVLGGCGRRRLLAPAATLG